MERGGRGMNGGIRLMVVVAEAGESGNGRYIQVQGEWMVGLNRPEAMRPMKGC